MELICLFSQQMKEKMENFIKIWFGMQKKIKLYDGFPPHRTYTYTSPDQPEVNPNSACGERFVFKISE